MLATLAAAEAAGIARWCLDTAVDYAKVREQFGRTDRVVPGDQAPLRRDARGQRVRDRGRLGRRHGVPGARRGRRRPVRDRGRDRSRSVAPDLGVQAAQTCIQVLGGIGYTWEHDAHLYLRRAIVARQLARRHRRAGGCGWPTSRCPGVRRVPHLELAMRLEPLRTGPRELVPGRGAACDEQRRALADSGLLMPHWPVPYGRGAGPQEQIVIEEEYAAAGVERPSLAHRRLGRADDPRARGRRAAGEVPAPDPAR